MPTGNQLKRDQGDAAVAVYVNTPDNIPGYTIIARSTDVPGWEANGWADTGYFGALYKSDLDGSIIWAHRGTDQWTDGLGLGADADDNLQIIRGEALQQFGAVDAFAGYITNVLRLDIGTFNEAGHSLGNVLGTYSVAKHGGQSHLGLGGAGAAAALDDAGIAVTPELEAKLTNVYVVGDPVPTVGGQIGNVIALAPDGSEITSPMISAAAALTIFATALLDGQTGGPTNPFVQQIIARFIGNLDLTFRKHNVEFIDDVHDLHISMKENADGSVSVVADVRDDQGASIQTDTLEVSDAGKFRGQYTYFSSCAACFSFHHGIMGWALRWISVNWNSGDSISNSLYRSRLSRSVVALATQGQLQVLSESVNCVYCPRNFQKLNALECTPGVRQGKGGQFSLRERTDDDGTETI